MIVMNKSSVSNLQVSTDEEPGAKAEQLLDESDLNNKSLEGINNSQS